VEAVWRDSATDELQRLLLCAEDGGIKAAALPGVSLFT
jgi:hypothetical protein